MRRIMRSFAIAATAALASAATAPAEATSTLSPWVQGFVKARAPDVALTHVGVIDGMGALAREHQTLIISDGKITAVGDASSIAVPMQAKVVDLNGKTTIPGLVGMHEHVFYSNGWGIFAEMPISFPLLYLAGGVTTSGTAGTFEPESCRRRGTPAWHNHDWACSIGFREAAALGIDNIEHGLIIDTEFHPEKKLVNLLGIHDWTANSFSVWRFGR